MLKAGKKPAAKVSKLVAPPTMFEADMGVSETENAVVISRALAKHSFKVGLTKLCTLRSRETTHLYGAITNFKQLLM